MHGRNDTAETVMQDSNNNQRV